MTISGSFVPLALTSLIRRFWRCSPPVHFSPFNSRFLCDSAWKKRPNSSMLNKFNCNLYLDSIVGRWVSFQCAVISGVHDFASPYTVLNVTFSCAFHLSPHRFSVLKSASILLNHSSNVNEVIRAVLNLFMFFYEHFYAYKKHLRGRKSIICLHCFWCFFCFLCFLYFLYV